MSRPRSDRERVDYESSTARLRVPRIDYESTTSLARLDYESTTSLARIGHGCHRADGVVPLVQARCARAGETGYDGQQASVRHTTRTRETGYDDQHTVVGLMTSIPSWDL